MIVDVVDVVGIVIVGESSYVRGTPLAGAMFLGNMNAHLIISAEYISLHMQNNESQKKKNEKKMHMV